MLSLLLTLSMLEFWNQHPAYTPEEIENLSWCVHMTAELNHEWCELWGNIYGSPDKKYLIYDEFCTYTGKNKVTMYERKYVIIDLKECTYRRYGDGELYWLKDSW